MNQVSVKRGYRTCSSCGGEGTKISYDYPDLPHVICDDCGGERGGLGAPPREGRALGSRARAPCLRPKKEQEGAL